MWGIIEGFFAICGLLAWILAIALRFIIPFLAKRAINQ